MKTIFKITSLSLLFLLFFSVSTAMAASFTADLVKTQRGKTDTEKFYLLNQNYRMEGQEGDKPIVIIADKEKKVHHVLDVKEKVFFDIASDDFKVLSMDPFAAAEYIVSTYGSQTEGIENINGMECEMQVVKAQDKKIMTRWVSTEMNFPVKIIMHQGKQDSVVELKNITDADLQMNLFVSPNEFKQVEEPGAAAKRKREELRKQEEAYVGITSIETAHVPCYIKIAAGGELRVPVDKDQTVRVEAINQIKDESVLTVWPYREGKKVESIGVSPWKLQGRHDHRDKEYNEKFWRDQNTFIVDELRITVETGLLYAQVTQKGPDRKDFYNYGNLQNGTNTDPKRPVMIQITGDNPFGKITSGIFWLRDESGGSSDKISFEVKNNETVSFDYPADQKIKGVEIKIGMGDGRAKITVKQPPSPDEKTATLSPKPKPAPTPVTEFTVTYPSGQGKGVASTKDLTIILTGITDDASGEIYLYSDRKKATQIDKVKFKLTAGESKSVEYSSDKKVGWISVWVYNGSFKVVLDQTPLGEKTTGKQKRF